MRRELVVVRLKPSEVVQWSSGPVVLSVGPPLAEVRFTNHGQRSVARREPTPGVDCLSNADGIQHPASSSLNALPHGPPALCTPWSAATSHVNAGRPDPAGCGWTRALIPGC